MAMCNHIAIFVQGGIGIREELQLYIIDIKYVRNLHKKDNNVLSVSPQNHKANRPFVGVITVCNNKLYCVPLSSPKEKHKRMKNTIDFSKVTDNTGKLIGVLNFNEMIPVQKAQIRPLDIEIHETDSVKMIHYKKHCLKELEWCRSNAETIQNKVKVLYDAYMSGSNLLCRKRCLKFDVLERECERYNEKIKARRKK